MKNTPLPWDGIAGPIYQSRELKPRKKWGNYFAWAMTALLIVGGLTTRYHIALVFGALFILTLVTKRDIVVTARGLEIFHQMRITTNYEIWPWSDISLVTRDDEHHPELVTLYITKGDRTKRLYFPRAASEAILKLAREQNPRLTAGDADPNSKRTASTKKR